MPMMSIDTGTMTTAAGQIGTIGEVFSGDASAIKSYSEEMQKFLSEISSFFSQYSGKASENARALSEAVKSMEWDSKAAEKFQASSSEFQKAVNKLSEYLSKISSSFTTINANIKNIVETNIVVTVQESAEHCAGDATNLANYALAQEENDNSMAGAYGG